MNVALVRAGKRYTVIRIVHYSKDLPKLCRREEINNGDEHCVVAVMGGKIIADAEGFWDRKELNHPDPFDLACERKHD